MNDKRRSLMSQRAVIHVSSEMVAKVLGELVQDERLRRGLSQDAMALMAKMDRSSYAKMERGERSTSLTQLIRICNVLECSCASIVKMVELNLPNFSASNC